jgi:pimeloyl-ACP methyl ester carboxylesterase
MPLVFSKEFRDRERDLLRQMFERAMAHEVSSAGIAGQMAAAVGHDTRSRLAEVRAPTLVVTGTRDKLVPPAQSRFIAERIPGARLVEIEGGTHGLPIEHADTTNALLTGWLAEHDGA